jgi:catechol 2,3-dioxygenase-like lactoylglutathione lyase family enzyme
MIRTVSHTTFAHVEIEKVRAFYLDFGLVISHETPDRIYFRGAGPRPYLYVVVKGDHPKLVSVSFEAESEAALVACAERFNAPIEQIDTPWGGKLVATRDPDGNRIEIVWGIPALDPLPVRNALLLNSVCEPVRLGRFPVMKPAPPPIFHLCHVVQQSPEPKTLIDWYVTQLAAYPSDVLLGEESRPVGAFMRFPRGDQYVPHHNVAVFEGPATGVQHVCFETLDLDALQLGHRYLRDKGYHASWGPVRHVLGGAISDYWHDPSGFRAEHVTDSDYLNNESATQYSPAGEDSLMTWGPGLPGGFMH